MPTVDEAVAALRDELADGTATIGTGPMAKDGEVAYDLPPHEIETHDRDVAGLGAVTVVEVELDMDASTYRFLNDPDNPNQRSPGEAVYTAMDAAGIRRPNNTPDLGVQLGSVGFEDVPDAPFGRASVRSVADKGHVTVQGYLPRDDAGGEAQTDGGLANIAIYAAGAMPPLLAVGAALLNDLGEEYTVKNDLDALSADVGLYNDGTDSITDTEDLSDITTEPSNGNYARQTEAFSASDLSGDWGTDTDTDTVFDVTSTTGTVNDYFVEVNFQASDTSDGAGTDHLIVTGDLSTSYDLSNYTQLTLSAGGVGWTVD